MTNLSRLRVERLTDLPIPHAAQPVFLVSLSEAIRLVRRRAQGLGLVLPEPGQWGAALEAYLAEIKAAAGARSMALGGGGLTSRPGPLTARAF